VECDAQFLLHLGDLPRMEEGTSSGPSHREADRPDESLFAVLRDRSQSRNVAELSLVQKSFGAVERDSQCLLQFCDLPAMVEETDLGGGRTFSHRSDETLFAVLFDLSQSRSLSKLFLTQQSLRAVEGDLQGILQFRDLPG